MTDEQLYTRRALAIMLGRDRNTITLALSDVPPDGEVRTVRGTYPGYKLSTAERALRRRNGMPEGDIDFDLDLSLGAGAIKELLQ
jgi:hypothetical protein